MHDLRLIRCSCCRLDQNVPAAGESRPVPSCIRCAVHRGDSADAHALRDADHAVMYQRAFVDAQDDTVLAYGERDFYRDKMTAACDSRALLVSVLAQIEDVHHYRGKRCACGRLGCRIHELLADPRIARLIRSHDEERRTLRELRDANPDAWGDRWDYIDEAVVFPRRTHNGRGRHRASG
jgi:hypothetical protein